MILQSSSSHPAGGSPRYIDEGYLELNRVIGTGAYGCVYLATDGRYPDQPYRAVKALRRHGLDTRQRQFQRREITLHQLASNHPSIVAMDRMVEDGDHTYVVMDYGEDGDLFAMICERQRYVGDDELIRSVFLQLLDGIAHIHNLGIAHRDIKPENIVCSNDGTRVRICDFGLATAELHSSDFGCGSTFYIAPECLGDWYPTRKSYPTKAGDIWSLGIILVNLVCGRNPWRIASPSDESFNAYLKDPSFLRRILPISVECLEVLKGIFSVEPYQRVSLSDLRKQILAVKSFSMSEQEVLQARAAAQVKQAQVQQQQQVKRLLVSVPPVHAEEEDMDDAMSEWSGSDSGSDSDGEVDDGVPFDLEDTDFDDEKLPSLRADSGSPSPPAERSSSSSSMGASLPPTPLLAAEDVVPAAHIESAKSTAKTWGDLFKRPSSSSSLRIRTDCVPSPNVITVGGSNPFFR